MSQDWDKLAGEKGEAVPQGKLNRMFTLGKMGAKVGLSTLANKAQSMLPIGSEESRANKLEQAYAQNAAEVVKTLGKLKGASMKVGQMLSADPELVPEGFADMLSSLQSSAPPMTYQTITSQVEQAFDLPMDVVFSYFDPDPIGAASIGQVHRARLAENNQEVAVKIQYPGVVDSLEDDLRNLGSMMVYARATINKARLDDYLQEIRGMILQEADYNQEAKNLAHFYELFAEYPGVTTPKPYPEWTRQSILTMEFIEGTKLDDALRAMDEPSRVDLMMRWIELYTWMFHEQFEMHADPHPGNFFVQEDGTLAVLDFGSVKSFDPAFADGILELLDTVWQDQPERALPIYKRLGFATPDFDFEHFDPFLLAQYHDIVFAPFLKDEPFDFSSWSPGMEGKSFMLKHPRMLKLVPPSEALPYFRMLSGVKGLLAKLDASVNVCRLAVETARRRGYLTAEPLIFEEISS